MKYPQQPGVTLVRSVELHDMEVLVTLCREHALFERAEYAVPGKARLLAHALFAPAKNLFVWIAERNGIAVGYASATTDFSTWLALHYTHMDCLFVREEYRGLGIGRLLLDAVRKHARDGGHPEIQWQTPAWNARAAHFYRREGASDALKLRFSIPA